MKERQPQKSLVMNAVSNWGAENIVSGNSVDFMYTEVWGSEDQFSDLYSIMKENKSYCNNSLNQVYAAYMNYDQKSSYFNTPGVLLTDAVMFALGAAHLELGGAPQELTFKQEGDYVTFTVPSLKYWTMTVVE